MIEVGGKYYLYRHIRVDKNTVFYVGMGTRSNSDIKKGTYNRAGTKNGRNIFWRQIVSVTDYISEIILESNDRDFIFKKEIEFIKLYGRKDLKEGHLSNLNDGGYGDNKSSTSIQKMIDSQKASGSYEKSRERMRYYAKLHNINGENNYKKTYIYNLDGSFFMSFKNRKSCSQYLNQKIQNIYIAVRRKTSCGGYFVANYKRDNINTTLFRISSYKRKVVQISASYEVVAIFESGSLAAKTVKGDKANILSSINGLRKCKGFYWGYEESYKETICKIKSKKLLPYPEERRKKAKETFARYMTENPNAHIHEKPVVNIETGEEYNGISEILSFVNYSRRQMSRRLSGEIVNRTSYRYLNI